MSRPRNVPDRGDVSRSAVASRLGLSLADFELCRDQLEQRGFPTSDPTTGLYAVEAVDRWRLRRYPRLFPELTGVQPAAHADTVFRERLARL